LREPPPFAFRVTTRLEHALVRGLDTYAVDMLAPVVHCLAVPWVSYVVYPSTASMFGSVERPTRRT
jgi:hypothetical protein